MSALYYEEGEKAQGQKVMLATPCYGSPCAAYVHAIARSREALTQAGIQSAYVLLQDNPHVDDARNAIVRYFLESDCTELVFLDADVDWEPSALVQLCKRDVDLVGGIYPFRRDGAEHMPVRLKEGARVSDDGLIEVEGLPTGFMKIKRHVLEKVAAKAPKYWDKMDSTALVFDRPDPGEDGTRWGGDIAFCNKWRALGGTLYADQELRLGHTAKIILRDSLGSHLRRISGTTMQYVAQRIRAGSETESDYNEVFKYAGDNFVADAGVLALCVGLARKCAGPIIETGSGLSSVLMGATTNEFVYALEHDRFYAARTVHWAEQAGVANVGVCCAPLEDGWYDIEKFDLPKKFSVGFCDGPPRMYGTRMKFFQHIAPRCTVVLVDDFNTDIAYANQVQAWADANGRCVQRLGRTALITKQALDLKMAA